MKVDYFAKDNENIIFTGKYMELYIPRYYIESKLCENIGDHFDILGVGLLRTFKDIEGKHPNKLEVLNIPTIISTFPNTFEYQTLDLRNNGNEEEYLVLKYYNKDIFSPIHIVKRTEVFTMFLKTLRAGKVPSAIGYDDILSILMKSMALNGIDFPITQVIYEIIIMKIYRDKDKPEQPFGVTIGKNPKISPYDYITANAREITSYSSTFAALSFEDIDTMMINSINNAQENKKETTSPLEEIVKY